MATPPDAAEKARRKAENTARIRAEVDALLAADVRSLSFPECLERHGLLRGKIVEFQGLVIKGLFDFAAARELEPKLVQKIHEVEERAHALQAGAGGLPGAGDRQVPPR
ncbi:MAG TPA: hypothetical protein VI997_10050 [Candidatus Thermoplasmatota archaeon]|nr:hypothetical protein [Candidatus Thermoplasmatota archaeon]